MENKEEALENDNSKKIKVDKESGGCEKLIKKRDYIVLKKQLFKNMDNFLELHKGEISEFRVKNLKDGIEKCISSLKTFKDSKTNQDVVNEIESDFFSVFRRLSDFFSASENITNTMSEDERNDIVSSKNESTCDENEYDSLGVGEEPHKDKTHDHKNINCTGKVANNIFTDTSDKNIFAVSNTPNRRPVTSMFLQSGVTKQPIDESLIETNCKAEYENVIFKEQCTLYKYIKKWEKIGTGVVYVIEESLKRCFFIRDEIMSRSIDFNIVYDSKPYKKSNGVGFLYKQTENDILKSTNVLLIFDKDECINTFYQILKADFSSSKSN